MKSKNRLVLLIFVAIAIVIFIVFADSAISSKAVPSLGDYIASSTASTSSAPSFNALSSITPSPRASSLPITGDESLTLATSSRSYSYASTTIQAPKGIIHALIADTQLLQEHGLSDRTSLAANEGMLFIFPQPSQYSFWMKDMNFPIDIVWIDSGKTVVKIDTNVSPSTYPNLYRPPSAVPYVLELNANKAASLGIGVGLKVTF